MPAWLAAAFLHQLGADLEDEGVQFLAQLGDWHEGDPKAGPRTLATGLGHLASFLLVAQHAPLVGGEDTLMSLIQRLFPQL